MPKVSVIIPVYNRAVLVKNAIDSVLNQTYPDYEIIVIDDGSTDNCQEVLHQYGDRIRVITQQNGGTAKARNTGLEHAEGDYLCFLDSDDTFFPEKLARQVEFLDTHPEIDVVLCGFRVQTVIQPGEIYSAEITRIPTGDLLYALLWQGSNGLFPPLIAMVRRKTVDRVGNFNPHLRIREEFDFWLRMAVHGMKCAVIPEVLCEYNNSPDSKGKNVLVLEDTMRIIYEGVFSSPNLPLKIMKLENEIRARTYMQLCQYFMEEALHGNGAVLEQVKGYLRKAFSQPAGVFHWHDETITTFIYIFMAIFPIDTLKNIRLLIPSIQENRQTEKLLESRINLNLAYKAFESKHYADVTHFLARAIQLDYRLVMHSGVLSMLVKSLVRFSR